VSLILAAIFISLIFFISCLNWQRTVKAALVLVVIEGALRKWVFPDASEMIYFLKDIVILGAYVNYFGFSKIQSKWMLNKSTVNILIFIVAGWGLFQIFNPSLGSPLVGFFGWKAYLYYAPLMWMVPDLFRSESELKDFLNKYLLLLIPVGILAVAQFFSPASSPLNVYVRTARQGISTFGIAGMNVRVTGTFSYLSGYAVYLSVCFGLLMPLLLIKQPLRWRILVLIEAFLLIVTSLMTGARSLVFLEVLFLLGYLIIQALSRPSDLWQWSKKMLLPSLAIAIAAGIWFAPAIESFWKRATLNEDVPQRIANSFTQPFEFFKYKQIDGYGIGAAHQATPALRQALSLPPGEIIPVYNELETSKIALELGPIGFSLWYALRISILVTLGLLFLKLKSRFLRQLALCALLVQAISINGQLVFNHIYAVYYWFISGFIFLLPQLEKIENWQQKQKLLFYQNVPPPDIAGSPYRQP
jgi:hypothetical protein